MMEFLAANFNLPTIIVSIFVFGGTGWLLYHEHKTGGLGCCDAVSYTHLTLPTN